VRLPSKKLLSAVLNKKVVNVIKLHEKHTNTLELLIKKRDDKEYTVKTYINIYELTHKCKEWALTKNLFLSSDVSRCLPADSPNRIDIWYCSIGYKVYVCPSGKRSLCTGCKHSEIENTEPEAVFKACEWIIESYKTLEK